jgi:hypothetical protein
MYQSSPVSGSSPISGSPENVQSITELSFDPAFVFAETKDTWDQVAGKTNYMFEPGEINVAINVVRTSYNKDGTMNIIEYEVNDPPPSGEGGVGDKDKPTDQELNNPKYKKQKTSPSRDDKPAIEKCYGSTRFQLHAVFHNNTPLQRKKGQPPVRGDKIGYKTSLA